MTAVTALRLVPSVPTALAASILIVSSSCLSVSVSSVEVSSLCLVAWVWCLRAVLETLRCPVANLLAIFALGIFCWAFPSWVELKSTPLTFFLRLLILVSVCLLFVLLILRLHDFVLFHVIDLGGGRSSGTGFFDEPFQGENLSGKGFKPQLINGPDLE